MWGSLLVRAVATAAEADEGGNNLPITLLLVALAVLVLAIVLIVVRRARKAALGSTRSASPSQGRSPRSRSPRP